MLSTNGGTVFIKTVWVFFYKNQPGGWFKKVPLFVDKNIPKMTLCGKNSFRVFYLGLQ